jgi:DNA-binding MarR family transcriptional regulator
MNRPLDDARRVRRTGKVADLPLNSDEDLVWRSLMRLLFTLRPALDEDLQRSCGLSSTEYSVLMHLSESPDRQLRMSDLADRTNLSPSRISRVIDEMARLGLVERRPGAGDGRNTYAALTRAGLATLRRAWPHHLRSVRRLSFDHLTAEEARILGPILHRLAQACDSSRSSTGHATATSCKRSVAMPGNLPGVVET